MIVFVCVVSRCGICAPECVSRSGDNFVKLVPPPLGFHGLNIGYQGFITNACIL